MNKKTASTRARLHLTPIANAAGALGLLLAAQHALADMEPANSLDKVVITGQAAASPAVTAAPSQNSLDASSAQSMVGDNFVRNYIAPVSDYTQVVLMTPGAFSSAPNGVGLGDSKITMRGLTDGNMVISFDGIPFNDTNGVSHHSWVFFPAQFLGGAVVDRSPGSAASIGQATFGGTIDLRSRVLDDTQRTTVSLSDGSWNTRQLGLEEETGNFGTDGRSNLLFNVQEMKSDGYQTFNKQDRKSTSAKYRYDAGNGTVFTVFGSFLNLKSNTPNTKGVSRANYDAGNYTTLLSGDPTQANYYGYNFYDIDTDFFYAGVTSNLGNGWKLDDKAYSYRYWNKQNYNSATAISATSAVDKLNSYTTFGNIFRLSQTSSLGELRLGAWIDEADSWRYQIPSDPRTWVDVSAPNFNESYTTTTFQPYLEYEFHLTDSLQITPGIKFASYEQRFVHLQDNGGAVGTLGGTFNKTTNTITGGAASLSNDQAYGDVLPSVNVHYAVRPDWTVYGQYAVGDQIPDTSVFDVKNAKVSPPPKAIKAKTLQFGTVWNDRLMSVSADIYHTKLDGAYTALPPDAFGNVGYVLSGTETNQGVEGEATFVLGQGFSVYVNGTLGSLKYASGQWVAGAPHDTEAVSLNYQANGWALGVMANRIGRRYGDAKDGTHQAFTLDAVTTANLFANYTIAHPMPLAKKLKLQLGINNLFNNHSIVAVASPVGASPAPADLLTVNAARSVSGTVSVDF